MASSTPVLSNWALSEPYRICDKWCDFYLVLSLLSLWLSLLISSSTWLRWPAYSQLASLPQIDSQHVPDTPMTMVMISMLFQCFFSIFAFPADLPITWHCPLTNQVWLHTETSPKRFGDVYDGPEGVWYFRMIINGVGTMFLGKIEVILREQRNSKLNLGFNSTSTCMYIPVSNTAVL